MREGDRSKESMRQKVCMRAREKEREMCYHMVEHFRYLHKHEARKCIVGIFKLNGYMLRTQVVCFLGVFFV